MFVFLMKIVLTIHPKIYPPKPEFLDRSTCYCCQFTVSCTKHLLLNKLRINTGPFVILFKNHVYFNIVHHHKQKIKQLGMGTFCTMQVGDIFFLKRLFLQQALRKLQRLPVLFFFLLRELTPQIHTCTYKTMGWNRHLKIIKRCEDLDPGIYYSRHPMTILGFLILCHLIVHKFCIFSESP